MYFFEFEYIIDFKNFIGYEGTPYLLILNSILRIIMFINFVFNNKKFIRVIFVEHLWWNYKLYRLLFIEHLWWNYFLITNQWLCSVFLIGLYYKLNSYINSGNNVDITFLILHLMSHIIPLFIITTWYIVSLSCLNLVATFI